MIGRGAALAWAATGTFSASRAVYAEPQVAATSGQPASDKLDRTVLPIPEPKVAFGGLQRTIVSSPQPLAPGRHKIVYQFVPDSPKPGAGGKSQLSVDGKPVGEAHVPHTMPFAYSGDEGVDVGMDNETPVTEEYKVRNNKFAGKIHKVTIELK